MVCKVCGTDNNASSKVCTFCGNTLDTVAVPKSAPVAAKINNTSIQITTSLLGENCVCPLCKDLNSIQRVPALVAAGTARGNFSGPSGGIAYINGAAGYTTGYTSLSGTLTSDIAESLTEPMPPKEISLLSLYGWSCLFYLSCWTIIGPFLVWPSFKRSIAQYPINQKIIFTPGVSFMCVIFLFLGMIPFFFPFWFIGRNMMNKNIDYPRRYKLWQEAHSKWEKFYYCHRCGIVFNPVTNEQYQITQLKNILRIYEFEL